LLELDSIAVEFKASISLFYIQNTFSIAMFKTSYVKSIANLVVTRLVIRIDQTDAILFTSQVMFQNLLQCISVPISLR